MPRRSPTTSKEKKRGLGAILARVVNKDRAGGPEEQIKRNIRDKPAIDPDSDSAQQLLASSFSFYLCMYICTLCKSQSF